MTRRLAAAPRLEPSGLEASFDAAFAAELALREKQIQQSYRPIIGVHKWFARQPGSVFRALLLSEFCDEPLREAYWHSHEISGVIGDPFMGGGTPIYEANRLGFHVVGCDVNPMAYWIVRQSLSPVDLDGLRGEAERVIDDVEAKIGQLYKTTCEHCNGSADVKYFLWVKTIGCACGETNDLFPGYRLAEAERHPRHVLACSSCGSLNEYDEPPTKARPAKCRGCRGPVHLEGTVNRKKFTCRKCSALVSYPKQGAGPPKHRLWAIEYHCERCYADRVGRMFKAPDIEDHRRFGRAAASFAESGARLPIPDDEIPRGDETDRLHRWGYLRYREMFNDRQLLALGTLLARIQQVRDEALRHALLTVFSDTLRYQNMLCRYDTMALKCQDIFSVHGFPVGLVQCENSVLGLAGIGSGSFRHFVEKFIRAKAYCEAPFETRHSKGRKEIVRIKGETIGAALVDRLPRGGKRKAAVLVNAPSHTVPLGAGVLDGVFTDPPYFDNVQYAELIDFCFVWLRRAMRDDVDQFAVVSTRSAHELTGNETLGRGLDQFTDGISRVFCHFAKALKPGAPFVFTYHHNDPGAYLPLIVAILDAGLDCTATLPAAAEMTASLHISGTDPPSSTLCSCADTSCARRREGRRSRCP